MALSICEDIGKRIALSGGAALIIDYGEDFVQEDSLRAFKKHTQVHPLSEVSRCWWNRSWIAFARCC
jgi:SAM-dependent MidA family methyltransferase